MKKLLFLLLLFSVFAPLQASHIAGGKIWYEYAGSAQHPNRYDVYLIIYRDVSGITMCPGYCPAPICITSSCFPQQNVSAQLFPFVLQPGSDTLEGSYPGSIITPYAASCIDSNSPGMVSTEAYRFHAQVDLPGKCADYRFAYSVSARNPSSNLINSSLGNFTIKATLNNTQENNSSPKFLNPGVRSFCVGQTYEWSQAAIEPDGDSLYYDFGTPQAGTCTSPTNMSFSSGYSASSPMTTANGITIDHSTGMLRFTPSQMEVDVINIQVSEYDFIPALGLWYLKGSSIMDVMVPVVSGCTSNQLSFKDVFQDTIKGNCGDSLVRLTTSEKFFASSLAGDGSDFALINSQGNLLPIIAAGVDPAQAQKVEINSFWLKLKDSIYYNDNLTLVSRIGNDLNSLVNICNLELNAGDTIPFIVSSCNTGIGNKEAALEPKMQLFPNPVKNTLHIHLPSAMGSGSLSIYDLKGKKVYSGEFTSPDRELILDFLPSGMYILKATADQWSGVSQFEKL